MSTLNFRRTLAVIVSAILVWTAVEMSSSSFAGPASSKPTLEGGPTYVNPNSAPAAKLQGTPLPSNIGTAGIADSSGGAASQGRRIVPTEKSFGGNNFSGGSTSGAAVGREKVSAIDTKTLSSNSDGKFSSSLMNMGLQSSEAGKSSSATSTTASGSDKHFSGSLLDSGLKPVGAATEKETAQSQSAAAKSSQPQTPTTGGR